MKRRSFIGSAVGAAGLMTVVACTQGTTDTATDGTSDNGAGGGSFLSMTAGSATTFVRNYNQPSPAAEKGPGASLIYEPLLRTLWLQGGDVEPWLAETFEWNADGTELTFALREGVTWSDGEAFDADDVVFSLNLGLENPEFNLSGSVYTSVERIDDMTVLVSWDSPAYIHLPKFGTSGGLEILPEHQYAGQDLTTWTNEEPVGTGPYRLSNFSAQQVVFSARDDYWNGVQAVQELRIPASTDDTTRPLLLSGEVDVSTMAWPNPEEDFVGTDPENNNYSAIPNGTAEALLFNNARAPFDDVNVRRAISRSLDAAQMITLYDVGTTPANISGMNYDIFSEVASPQYADMFPMADPQGALEALEESDYTVTDGRLERNGEQYDIELLLPQGNTNWVTWGRGFIDQLNSALGLTVTTNPISDETFWPRLDNGEFSMAFGFVGNGLGAHANFSPLDSANALPIGEPTPINQFRYSNSEVDDAVAQLEVTQVEEEVKQASEIIQTRILEDVPFYPLFNAAWFLAYTEANWTNWPDHTEREIVPTWMHGPDWTLTLQQLEPAGD